MYFEIFETYPAQIISQTFSSISIPVVNYIGDKRIIEHLKLYLPNNDADEIVKTIKNFYDFCESALSNESKKKSFDINIKNMDMTSYVRYTFKAVPTQIKISLDEVNINKMKISFLYSSSSITNKHMIIETSTFFFIFSCLINIRNFFEYNSWSFGSAIKTQSILQLRAITDKLFDELIVSPNFKGYYESRYRRTTNNKGKELQSVYEAIRKCGKSYNVKEYSVFTVEEQPFLMLENTEDEEILLFEYKYVSKMFDIEI